MILILAMLEILKPLALTDNRKFSLTIASMFLPTMTLQSFLDVGLPPLSLKIQMEQMKTCTMSTI